MTLILICDSQEEAEMFIAKILMELLEVVNKFTLKKECSAEEAECLSSKSKLLIIPHFYIIWKSLKRPPIGRPIVAAYDWIFIPASIVAEHFLKEFYFKVCALLFQWKRLLI